MTASRLRGLTLATTALVAALLLLAWSQQWFAITLAESTDAAALTVGGDVAAAGLAPVALTLLAVVAALAIAGPVFRTILGVLEAGLGLVVILLVVDVTGDPVGASASAITDATGLTGSDALQGLVAGIETSAWPWVALVLGALVILIGGATAATARRWPVSGRKYTRTRTAPADGGAPDAVEEWDALTDGDDPTAPAR